MADCLGGDNGEVEEEDLKADVDAGTAGYKDIKG